MIGHMAPTPTPTSTPHAAGTGTRRDRHRSANMAELRAAALAELHERGPTGLSLRGVARRMGMSPAGLYRYVDSRDALLTLLIADAYDDLADGVRAALVAVADADVADRLEAVCLAYRAWGVARPREFALVFGDPIPGYAAPAGGPTVDAMGRFGLAFATPLVEAWAQGRLVIPPELDDPALAGATTPMAGFGGDIPPAGHALFLVVWGRVHGQVALEVFGHHAWLFPDGCLPLFRAEVRTLARDLGLVAAQRPRTARATRK